jgi:hypothetical protein
MVADGFDGWAGFAASEALFWQPKLTAAVKIAARCNSILRVGFGANMLVFQG